MPEKREIVAALLREHPDGWTADSLLNALHQERLEIVPRYGHTLEELRDEFWRVALAIGCEPGDYGGTVDDIDVLSVVTDQVRWNVQERDRLSREDLTDQELATVLTAIDNMGQIMSGPAPTPQTRERADTALALLASAEQKLRAMHGLPTGPAA